MKKFIYQNLRTNLSEESFFHKTRNQKVESYIKVYQRFYEMNSGDLEKYIIFEQTLKNLKKEMTEASMMQLKFVEKINNHYAKIM